MPFIRGSDADKLRRPIKAQWHALRNEQRANQRTLLQLAKQQPLTLELRARMDAITRTNDALARRMQELEREFEMYIVRNERIDTPIR